MIRYQIQYRDEVDSTNLWAKELARAGACEGTVVTADRQSAGRGRLGRSWVSPSGTSIYMSLILRPQIRPEQASMLTLVMGLSVVQACRKLLGVDAWIKWPNDMVIGSRKVCGILTEMELSMAEELQGTDIAFVIVGVGINVNQHTFADEIKETATSLSLESGKEISREAVLEAVLDTFVHNYECFLKTGDLKLLANAYNQVLINKGKSIRVLDPAGEYNGVSDGINEKGELLVIKEDGTCALVYAGEVSVRGIYGYV